MNIKWQFTITLIFFGCFVLSACQNSSSATVHANRYVQRLEAQALSRKSDEVLMKPIIPVSYHVAKLRDPFEVLEIKLAKSKTYPDTVLRGVALDSLTLVGIVTHAKVPWAVFRTNTGQLFKAIVGTRIGLEHSLLTHIDKNQVRFTQEVQTSTGPKKQVIEMHIQGPKE